MSKWKDSYGNIYETEDDARDNAINEMTWDDICEYFKTLMTFEDLFETIRKEMPNFYDEFEMEILDAEDDYFNKNYTKMDTE
jgi:hypothetical protein